MGAGTFFKRYLIVLLLLVAAGQCYAALPDVSHHVLIINSYQQGIPWTHNIMSALETSLVTADPDIELHIDYMHTARFKPGEKYFLDKYKVYSYEFSKYHFNLVICIGLEAFNFLLYYGDKMFPNTPVIIAGIGTKTTASATVHPNYIGIPVDFHLKQNLKLITQLFPKTRKIVFAHDQMPGGLDLAADVHALKPEFPHVRFTYLTDMNMDEVLTHIRRLPPDAVLMPLPFIIDKSGKFFVSDTATNMMANESPVPAWGLFNFQLREGIIGGLLLDETKYGKLIADVAQRVLAGENIKKIKVKTEGVTHYMFNYKQVRRFGLPISALPEGSTIVGKPPSYFQQHKEAILTSLGAGIFLLTIITILSINIFQRKHAETILRESEARYKTLFDQSPDIVMMLQEQRIVAINPAVNGILGYEPQEVIGLFPWQISPECQPDGTPSKEKAIYYIDLACKTGVQSFDWVHQHKNSSDVYCNVNLVVYEVDNESYVQAIVRDVTERKRAEDAKREFEHNIEKQKRRFYRDTILSVTNGKFNICDAEDIEPYIQSAEIKFGVNNRSDVPVARSRVEEYCRGKGLRNDELQAFMIGVGEAITNAIKHAPEGHVYAGTSNGDVWVGVADNGPGIDSVILPYVALRRGYSTKKSMGLGYSIMLDVADQVLLKTGEDGTTVILSKSFEKMVPEISIDQLPDTWDSVS